MCVVGRFFAGHTRKLSSRQFTILSTIGHRPHHQHQLGGEALQPRLHRPKTARSASQRFAADQTPTRRSQILSERLRARMRHRAEKHCQLDRQKNVCTLAAATVISLQQQTLQSAHYAHSRHGFDAEKRPADKRWFGLPTSKWTSSIMCPVGQFPANLQQQPLSNGLFPLASRLNVRRALATSSSQSDVDGCGYKEAIRADYSDLSPAAYAAYAWWGSIGLVKDGYNGATPQRLELHFGTRAKFPM